MPPSHAGNAVRLLREVFGYEAFRPGQAEIIDAVMAGDDVLAVMPTGAGKSLCFQIPALLAPGLTVVISPLIALMRDQVSQLRANGVAAAALNSLNSPAEDKQISTALRARAVKLVYVAPERLVRPDTQNLLREAGAWLMAIDEAHCVSQWGHDFRPEYRSLPDLRAACGIRQTLAVTATADAPTRNDIARLLLSDGHRSFLHSFDRPNLRLAMAQRRAGNAQLLARLARHKGQSGIVYAASRRGVDDLAADIGAAGYQALPYHAGMDKDLRSAHQDSFLREDGVVMVATVAFGMGIDKPDVRFVLHANLPSSIEAYYQEIGRAGRDGLPADTLTLYSPGDMQLRRRQIAEADSDEARKRIDHRKLDALIALCETPRCRRQTLLAAFGESAEPCGNCDVCAGAFTLVDGSLMARKAMSAIVRTQGRFSPPHLTKLLKGQTSEAMTRHGHDLLPTFGVGRDLSEEEWRSVFTQIQAAGLVRHDADDRDRLVLSEPGWAVLRGEMNVQIRSTALQGKLRRRGPSMEEGDEASPVQAAVDIASDGQRLSVRQTALLNALKSRRAELARAQRVPAFVIFHDRTLIDMAVRSPRSKAEFAQVHGVGAAKCAQYAADFLAVIKQALAS
ncbi:MAG: DNA helicase RecQ [Hyphomicrobiales bacterium]|nr:DNA helicase RecQ [Hyphomicrobiales bacterium]